MKRIQCLLSIFFILLVPIPVGSQTVCPPPAGPTTTAMLATCLAKVQEQLDSVLAVNHQIRLTGGGEHNGLSVDSIRPNSSFGFDSQGTLTGRRRYVGQQTYGSDWWLFDDVRNGVVQLTSPQPGVKVQICQTPQAGPYAYSSDCR